MWAVMHWWYSRIVQKVRGKVTFLRLHIQSTKRILNMICRWSCRSSPSNSRLHYSVHATQQSHSTHRNMHLLLKIMCNQYNNIFYYVKFLHYKVHKHIVSLQCCQEAVLKTCAQSAAKLVLLSEDKICINVYTQEIKSLNELLPFLF